MQKLQEEGNDLLHVAFNVYIIDRSPPHPCPVPTDIYSTVPYQAKIIKAPAPGITSTFACLPDCAVLPTASEVLAPGGIHEDDLRQREPLERADEQR